MSDQEPFDQETYDRLIAEGKSEDIARAQAKAAAIRAQALGADDEHEPPEAYEEAKQAAERDVEAAKQPAEVGASPKGGARPIRGGLTPEEKAQRVAASLEDGNGHHARLLALVPPSEQLREIRAKQEDRVYTWPHLLIIEFVALLSMGSLILVLSFFLDAPLRALANPNLTPNPSKAPWYFLGLQEMLHYFHPMVAGVLLPGMALAILAATAYFDKNPSVKPDNRKFANMAFTFFIVMWTVLMVIGIFFRGPGFNWTYPWQDGLFFELP